MKSQTRQPTRLLVALAYLLPLTLLTWTAGAEEPARDPVLASVLEMLEADLSEAVILDWLGSSQDRPQAPGASDLIDLRQAGASDRLMHRVLELSRLDTSKPTPVRPGKDVAPATASPTDTDSSDVLAPVGELRGLKALGAVDTRFTLSYAPYRLEGEEEWQLLVYLDGEPLTVVAEGSLIDSKALRFSKLLPQGDHRLQIMLERHATSRRFKEHRARVAPKPIELSLSVARRAEIEIAFKQNLLDQQDPVHYQVRINGRPAGEGEMGGRVKDWRELCEDREASSRRHRGSGDCIAWKDLWASDEVPSREQVLEALALFDYRPVPRDQKMH